MKRVGWEVSTVLGLALVVVPVYPVRAAEHGGKEHGGAATTPSVMPTAPTPAPTPAASPAQDSVPASSKGIPSAPVVAPTAEQIREAIQTYVQDTTQDEGKFYVDDEVTGEARELTLDHVHERVGKTGEYYYSCADMKDVKTSDLVDVDFDVEAYDGGLEVVDVRIHKVNGQARYTYDDKDNRIPVTQ